MKIDCVKQTLPHFVEITVEMAVFRWDHLIKHYWYNEKPHHKGNNNHKIGEQTDSSQKKDKNSEMNVISLVFLDQEKMPPLEDSLLIQRHNNADHNIETMILWLSHPFAHPILNPQDRTKYLNTMSV